MVEPSTSVVDVVERTQFDQVKDRWVSSSLPLLEEAAMLALAMLGELDELSRCPSAVGVCDEP